MVLAETYGLGRRQLLELILLRGAAIDDAPHLVEELTRVVTT